MPPFNLSLRRQITLVGAVFVILLIFSFFTLNFPHGGYGHGSALSPTEVKGEETQPVDTQPVKTKPEDTKPEKAKPEKTKPEKTKPEKTKPEKTKPEKTKPEKTKPEKTKPEEEKQLGLPSEYSATPTETGSCTDFYGIPYLEHLRDSATDYCTPESSSSLTCFHVKVTNQLDTFCIGQNAVFDPASRKFHMDCELGQLEKPQILSDVPEYGFFHNYWYETGPGRVLASSVELQNLKEPEWPSRAPNHTILVKREGSHNLWHSLMEILSLSMSLDVLQISSQRDGRGPFLSGVDADNTQVVLLDDHADGPYIDLWSLFAKKPLIRFKDVPENTSFENIIVPLAGGSNPLWQGDWEIHSCHHGPLLRTFARRVLDKMGVPETQPSEEIVLTFINRVEGRRLIHQEAYLDSIRSTFKQVKVQSIDFAAISFHDQLQIIQNTDILVGVHGAGLTHGMFLKPRSVMVEILPPSLNHKGFRNLASLVEHSYFSAHGSPPPETLQKRDQWHSDDVYLEENKFLDLMSLAIRTMYNTGPRTYDVV